MSGRIGPHTGIEFILYDRGEKHVIYFSWDCWLEEYVITAEFVGAATLKFSTRDSEGESYIFYRPRYESKAKELRDIILSGFTIYDDDYEMKEHRIGAILGYTKEDVDLYVQNTKPAE